MSFVAEFAVKLAHDRIISGENCRCVAEHLMESRLRYLQAEDFARKQPDVFAECLNIGSLRDCASPRPADFPHTTLRHFLQHDRRVRCDYGDAVTIYQEIGKRADES